MTKKELSKYMKKLGKLSHKKSPRPKEFYVMIGKKSAEARKKKFSTVR